MVYAAQPDLASRRTLPDLLELHHAGDGIELRDLPRPDASSIDCTKPRELLGWRPRRTWRAVLAPDGTLLDP